MNITANFENKSIWTYLRYQLDNLLKKQNLWIFWDCPFIQFIFLYFSLLLSLIFSFTELVHYLYILPVFFHLLLVPWIVIFLCHSFIDFPLLTLSLFHSFYSRDIYSSSVSLFFTLFLSMLSQFFSITTYSSSISLFFTL